MENGTFDAVPLTLAVAALSTVGVIIVAFVPRWSDANERRRTRYAEAVEALIAWAEYPYRVARRTDDTPETLKELSTLGHALQERLAFHGAWVSAENAKMGKLYQAVLTVVRGEVGPATMAAWTKQPINASSQMNIGDLHIDQARVAACTRSFAAVSQNRFGWRRAFGRLNRRIKKETTPIPGGTHLLKLVQEEGEGG